MPEIQGRGGTPPDGCDMHATDGVILREATLVDADAIGLLHRISLQAGVEYGVPPAALLLSAADRGKEWREWLRAKGIGRAAGVVVVADSLHGSVGFACVCPPVPRRKAPAPHDWDMPYLTVMQAHQAQKVGSRLLQQALERAGAAGARTVLLRSPAEARWNPFYEACGGLHDGVEEVPYLGVSLQVIRYRFPVPGDAAAPAPRRAAPVPGVSPAPVLPPEQETGPQPE